MTKKASRPVKEIIQEMEERKNALISLAKALQVYQLPAKKIESK